MAERGVRNLFPNTELQAKIFLSILIVLPIVLFGVLIYAGVIILIALYALVFFFRRKGQELTWDNLKRKY